MPKKRKKLKIYTKFAWTNAWDILRLEENIIEFNTNIFEQNKYFSLIFITTIVCKDFANYLKVFFYVNGIIKIISNWTIFII